ncbi:MAG: S8 family serine peptidase [Planctomycetes bacterium]|nr:S8 family serine peptidase [Planctomycetota bacterium]
MWDWRRASPPGETGSTNRRRPTRLAVEQLESVLLLSVAPQELSYEDWRQQRFTVDDFGTTPGSVFAPVIDATSTGAGVQNQQARSIIGATSVNQDYGYTGNGYAVAVLDTGVDYNHPALAGNYVGGWDFVDNDADPMDLHGHGTHVAGTIASTNATYPGIAPDANIIALRVLDQDGSGTFDDVELALQWVASHQQQYNIVAVNMSLGAGNYSSNPYSFLEDELTTLKGQGVFIAAASGNSFFSYNSQQGLGYPAISGNAVAVGAVWDGTFGQVTWASGAVDYSTAPDRITSFTQRSSQLDILAPGAFITSTYLNSGFATLAGTSMASPVAAGAAVLVHQALDSAGLGSLANQNYILQLMQNTGVTLTDGDDENDNVVNTGLSFKRLNVLAAVQSFAFSSQSPPETVGLYSGGAFFLQESHAAGPADISFGYGPPQAGWKAVVGDWDGDGTATIGLYNANSGTFFLRNSNSAGPANVSFTFGPAGNNWVPISGDWDGDGDATLGLYNTATGTFYLRNSNSTGAADLTFRFGGIDANLLPVAGDWDGSGSVTIGLYSRTTGGFWLRNSNSFGAADVSFVYGPGGAAWQPIAGDWNGDGVDSVGLYNTTGSRFYLRNSQTAGSADYLFYFGPANSGWTPVVGAWGAGGSSASVGGNAEAAGLGSRGISQSLALLGVETSPRATANSAAVDSLIGGASVDPEAKRIVSYILQDLLETADQQSDWDELSERFSLLSDLLDLAHSSPDEVGTENALIDRALEQVLDHWPWSDAFEA